MTQFPPAGGPPIEYGPAAKPNGMAVAAMVLGIISLVTFCVWWLSIPCGVAAIVLAIVARGNIRKGQASGEGMAKAGLIMGIIGSIISALLIVLVLVGFSMFGDQLRKKIEEQQRIQQQQQQSSPRATPTTAPAAPTTTE